jgi:CRP/FNR family transcriptional regulator/CRP/FNR family cyclic AMP-dependent transcriptional regulator
MGHEFLKTIPLFAGLSDDQLIRLRENLIRRQFRQGQAIFQQGDQGQMLYLIESGQVRIFLQDEEGQETSVIVYGPGEIFGELAVIDGLPRSASAVAMENTVVYTLTRDSFRESMRAMPQLALNFLNALSVRVRYNTQQVESLTLHDVSSRLARKLLELAQQYGTVEPAGVRINLALTQSDLAGLVGATRESINKTLGTFRRQGYIVTRQNRVTIVDPDALRQVGP